MRYKGTYDPTATYEVGDVVIFENGVVYHLQKAAEAGTAPTDTRYWGQLEQNLSDAVKIVGNAGGGGGGSGGGGGMVVKLTMGEGGMVMDHTWKEIYDALPEMPVTIMIDMNGTRIQGNVVSISPGEGEYSVIAVIYTNGEYNDTEFVTDSEDGYPSAQA